MCFIYLNHVIVVGHHSFELDDGLPDHYKVDKDCQESTESGFVFALLFVEGKFIAIAKLVDRGEGVG